MTPERLTEIERAFPKNPIIQEIVAAVREAQAQIDLLHAGKGGAYNTIPPYTPEEIQEAIDAGFERDRLALKAQAEAHANGTCDPETCPIARPHFDGNGSPP